MMQKDDEDQRIIEQTMMKMRFPAHYAVDYQALQMGFSGARVYWITSETTDLLLKVTPTTRDTVIVERARRELAFYRDLASVIPLQVPKVKAMVEDAEVIALLFEAYHTLPPTEVWSVQDCMAMSYQLGQFHAMFWGKTQTLSHLKWLRWYQQKDFTFDQQQSHICWKILREQPHLSKMFTANEYGFIQHLLSQLSSVQIAVEVMPLTICHGDCNPSNILRVAPDNLIWVDWQETRLARGPEDLSFFIQRAAATGMELPDEEMMKIYHRSLQAHISQHIEIGDIERVLDASELWVRLIYWPCYMKDSSEAFLADMLERIHFLASGLGFAD